MHLPEQFVPSKSLLVHPGDQAIKDTVIGAGEHLCLPIRDEEIDFTCCPRCHRMKTHGCWLLQQLIHLLGECSGFFTESRLNGVMFHLGITQVHSHERLEIDALVATQQRCSL